MLQVILKMDKHGNGLEVDQSNLGRCRSLGDIFTEEKFRHMCILSGCDYLPSLHGIGLGKACKLLRLAKEPDILKVRLCTAKPLAKHHLSKWSLCLSSPGHQKDGSVLKDESGNP